MFMKKRSWCSNSWGRNRLKWLTYCWKLVYIAISSIFYLRNILWKQSIYRIQNLNVIKNIIFHIGLIRPGSISSSIHFWCKGITGFQCMVFSSNSQTTFWTISALHCPATFTYHIVMTWNAHKSRLRQMQKASKYSLRYYLFDRDKMCSF